MRSIRMVGLVAIAAIAAIAFVGASSASATTSTQLCKVHTGLTCPGGQATTAVHLTLASGSVGKLLSSVATILCLTVLVEASPLALAKPQNIHASALQLENCGSDAEHSNCETETEEVPLANILKTGLDEGVMTGINGQFLVVCEKIGGFIDVECKFDITGIVFAAGGQHLSMNEASIGTTGEKALCPSNPKLDGLLKTLHTESTETSALCKTHTSECAEKDQIKSLHMVTTKPPVLYNTIANIECDSSLGTATVLGPAEPQKLDFTELTWKDCHTQGSTDNCTVTSKSLPTLDLKKTALNLGTATTLGLKVGIDCTVLGLIELDCVYGSDVTLQAEGALHKEGTGHGMFTASKVVLSKLEGSGHCPESVKWDALYEPLEHVYVVGSSIPLSGEKTYILG